MSQNESKEERLNRELIELLNELRVALPGVQMLFGFLLAVPFTNRFPEITSTQRHVYYFTFMATAAATIFFIAPTAYHRLRFRQHDKEQLVRTSSHLTIAGTAFLAASLSGAVYLVSDLLFHTAATALAAAATAGLLLWFWYGLPLWRRIREKS
jgi:predicted membrane channel-forming protein YqfA (hemolysin III family)